MHSSSIEVNLTSRLYQEYSAKLHQRRLVEIKNRHNFSLNLSPESNLNNKPKIKGFLKLAKNKEVARQNKILYDKLTSISERKKNFDTNEGKSPKTLNFVFRKKQTEKIIKENQDFIQRLIEKPSQLSVNKFKSDYEMLLKYKENLSKSKINERIKKIVKNHPMPTLNELSLKNETSPDPKKIRNSSLPNISSPQDLSFTAKMSSEIPSP